MCTIKNNFSLKKYNTFGIDVSTKYYAKFSSNEELLEILSKINTQQFMILGGGSNMLFTKDIDKAVLHNDIKGINLTKDLMIKAWNQA